MMAVLASLMRLKQVGQMSLKLFRKRWRAARLPYTLEM